MVPIVRGTYVVPVLVSVIHVPVLNNRVNACNGRNLFQTTSPRLEWLLWIDHGLTYIGAWEFISYLVIDKRAGRNEGRNLFLLKDLQCSNWSKRSGSQAVLAQIFFWLGVLGSWRSQCN